MVRLFLVILFFSSQSLSKIAIPSGLSSSDREKVVSILGSGTSLRLLSDPYPLGGYPGLEFGFSANVLNTSELSRLGQRTASQSETTMTSFSIAKGLYQNVDVEFDFAPFEQSDGVSYYGAQMRWGFSQSKSLPLYWSLALLGSSTAFQNVLNVNNQELLLSAAYRQSDVSLLLGAGSLRSQGQFVGGVGGITDSGLLERSSLEKIHYLAGVNIDFSQLFLALEMDQYFQLSYSAKFGVRL